jgi:glycine/D-amino acid oxidase-like deaminating enzyme
MSTAHFDAVIAGGGIVGAACAAALAEAGLRAALIERDALGSGATAAGMGHIVVMDDSPAQFSLTRYSQQLWQVLAAEFGSRAEYEACGTVWVAADEEEMAEAERKREYYAARGVPSRLISGSELAEAEPNLRAGLAGALLVEEDAVVYSPAVAVHLAERARALGATLFVGRAVTRMSDGEALLDNASVLAAPVLINATGAWAPELTPGVQVRKRKGHLVITDRQPGFVRRQLVELGYLKSAHSLTADSVAFNVQPRKTGQILIGSSRQYGEAGSGIDQAILSAMLARAAHFMPELNRLPAIRVWTGFRAATPDKLPLIGPSAADPTLWLATGHEGLGITTSLGTAALIAALLTGAETQIRHEPFLPARFFSGQMMPDHIASIEHEPIAKESLCNGQA